MKKSSEALIGIDTAKIRSAVAVAERGRYGEVRYIGEFYNTPDGAAKLIRKLASRYETSHVCYEAGPISSGTDLAHVVTPRAHKVAALLNRWLIGTLQGGIQHQHLDYYLDEFAFRFNRRPSKARGMLFYRLAQQVVATNPTAHPDIINAGGD